MLQQVIFWKFLTRGSQDHGEMRLPAASRGVSVSVASNGVLNQTFE